MKGAKFSTVTKQLPAYVTVDGVQLKTSEYTTTYYEATTTEDSDKAVATGTDAEGAEIYLVPGSQITSSTVISDLPKYVFVKVAPKKAELYDATGADNKLTVLTRLVEAVAKSDKTHDVSKATVTITSTANATGKTSGKTKKIGYTGKEIFFDKASFGYNSEGDADAKAAYEKRQATISIKIGGTVVSEADMDKYFDFQYVNNIKTGTATLVVSAKAAPVDAEGNVVKNPYAGAKTKTFKIDKSAIQDQMKPAETEK